MAENGVSGTLLPLLFFFVVVVVAVLVSFLHFVKKIFTRVIICFKSKSSHCNVMISMPSASHLCRNLS